MRFVRPSWVKVSKSESDNGPKPFWQGTGPRGRSGSLSVEILARIKGAAVGVFTIDAIGSADGLSTVLRITDKRTGRTIHEETVNQ